MVSESTPKSEIGKISGQNWETDPKNSPKAFGELITDAQHMQYVFVYLYIPMCTFLTYFTNLRFSLGISFKSCKVQVPPPNS